MHAWCENPQSSLLLPSIACPVAHCPPLPPLARCDAFRHPAYPSYSWLPLLSLPPLLTSLHRPLLPAVLQRGHRVPGAVARCGGRLRRPPPAAAVRQRGHDAHPRQQRRQRGARSHAGRQQGGWGDCGYAWAHMLLPVHMVLCALLLHVVASGLRPCRLLHQLSRPCLTGGLLLGAAASPAHVAAGGGAVLWHAVC